MRRKKETEYRRQLFCIVSSCATVPIKHVIFPIHFVRAISASTEKKNVLQPSYSSGERERERKRERRIFPWYSANRVISLPGDYWGGRSDSTLKFLNRWTRMLFAKGNNRVELRYSNPRRGKKQIRSVTRVSPRKSQRSALPAYLAKYPANFSLADFAQTKVESAISSTLNWRVFAMWKTRL